MRSIESRDAVVGATARAEDSGAELSAAVAPASQGREPGDINEIPQSAAIGSANVAPAGRLGSWYLPRGRTLASFCHALNGRAIDYVVLPAATAPELQPTAVLVKDHHIPRIRDLITRIPLGQPLAVYCTTDLPGFAFQQHWRHVGDATNMAVLPPHLAEALLAGAEIDEQGFRVPAKSDLLLWAIYRALYLQGDANFVPRSWDEHTPTLVGAPVRFIGELARATDAKLSIPFTLEALHQHLCSSGWEPPCDVLRRLSPWNSWAALKTREYSADWPAEEPGMVAFFVRSQVIASGLYEDVLRMLDACGFELFKTIELDEQQIETATRATRGANWGPGALPVGGGPPVRIIVAFDVMPSPVPDEMRPNYPYLDNGRVLQAKQFCRGLIRDRLPRNRQFNPLHSTDDSADAWRIVRLFTPGEERAMRDLVESRRAAFETGFEVVQNLTRIGVRAKIELIRYRGELAVKKTFRHSCLRFLEREVAFMDAISPHRPEILPVLERGSNYFITPFVEARPIRRRIFGLGLPMLMPLAHVRAAADLLRYLFSRGYDPVDLGPHNLLIDGSGQLRAIDFEFVHKCDGPVEPETSACLNGIPENFEGDWPLMARWYPARSKCLIDPYGTRWFGHTGLTRRSFLHDPPALQSIKRIVNYPAYLGRKTFERQSGWLRRVAKASIKSRLPVLTRMAVGALRSRATSP